MKGIEFRAFGQTPDLHLAKAVLLYEHKRPGSESQFHATVHSIDHRAPNGPVILPGSLLTREALEDAVLNLSDTAQLRSWSFVDASVLASGSDMRAWFTPPCVRHMVFTSPSLTASGPASQPAMLWLAWRRELWVFALEWTGERPQLSDPVCHSPHFNVWRGGHVCLGSTPVPELRTPENWLDGFYGSAFSHPNDGSNWQVKHRGGVSAFWRRMLKEAGRKPFPMQALVRCGATIEQVVEAVMTTGVKQARGAA